MKYCFQSPSVCLDFPPSLTSGLERIQPPVLRLTARAGCLQSLTLIKAAPLTSVPIHPYFTWHLWGMRDVMIYMRGSHSGLVGVKVTLCLSAVQPGWHAEMNIYAFGAQMCCTLWLFQAKHIVITAFHSAAFRGYLAMVVVLHLTEMQLL